VITLYSGAIAVTYLLIAVGAISGILPRPTLIALATIPIALRVTRALWRDYDDPYALMFSGMGKNIQLHLFTGMLLFVGYLIAIAAGRLLDSAPAFLT
jgi:1,4-dihydroxy-2-naphthoate octaprenyltransferase